MNILIRTDGSRQLGNGHIIRMLALAYELSHRNIHFTFALKFDDFWISRIREKKFGIIQLQEGSDHIKYFLAVLKENSISHLVYDTRGDLSKEELLSIKKSANCKLVVIDSPEDTRLAADSVIFPPIPQIQEWDWLEFTGRIFSGWEYVLLRNVFSKKNVLLRPSNSKKILLSFGSTDPFFLTERMLELAVIHQQMFKGYEFILLVGPQFDRLSVIKESDDFKKLSISIQQAPEDIVALFSSVDFAFITFGVTAYELSALSIPFLCISPTEDHERSARIFEINSLGVSLGIINNFALDFKKKMDFFFQHRNTMTTRIKEFQSKNSISDWSKIIEAIIQ